jgi:hypothetical protein
MRSKLECINDWEYQGLRCVVLIEQASLAGYGYVGIRRPHPLFGMNESSRIAVPDGTTRQLNAHIHLKDGECLNFSAGQRDYPVVSDGEYWWFGFNKYFRKDRSDQKFTSEQLEALEKMCEIVAEGLVNYGYAMGWKGGQA